MGKRPQPPTWRLSYIRMDTKLMRTRQLSFKLPSQLTDGGVATPGGPVESKIVENRTARTIGIGVKSDKSTPGSKLLLIPPFGRRTLSRMEINNLECEDWERLRLIVREEPQVMRRAAVVLGDTVNYLISG